MSQRERPYGNRQLGTSGAHPSPVLGICNLGDRTKNPGGHGLNHAERTVWQTFRVLSCSNTQKERSIPIVPNRNATPRRARAHWKIYLPFGEIKGKSQAHCVYVVVSLWLLLSRSFNFPHVASRYRVAFF